MNPLVYLIFALFVIKVLESRALVPRWLSVGVRLSILVLAVLFVVISCSEVRH